MIIKCKKCSKEFKYKCRLNKHLNKKNPCDKVKEDLKCDVCNMVFRHNQKTNIICRKINKDLTCYLCNTTFNRISHRDAHHMSKKHIKNVKFLEHFIDTIKFNEFLIKEIMSDIDESLILI